MASVRSGRRARIVGRITSGVLLVLVIAPGVSAQPMPFFPGAEGYGGSYLGTAPAAGWLANATVYHVTSLENDGPGSFREAFDEDTSNKIIVFDVAGTIQLTDDNLDIKNLTNYYVAGQTAPGPVTIYGRNSQVTHSPAKVNRNVVLRYLSFRKGDGQDEDTLSFAGGGLGTNIIFDHISASWSEDEILSVANNNTDLTVQYTTIHDALYGEENSDHAYGSLIRPRISSNVTFHHDLYANNTSRQARFGTYYGETLTADFRNNVIYNWKQRASYAGGSSENDREFADVNYVGNYLIAGPGTQGSSSRAFSVDKNTDTRIYQSGNFIDSDKSPNPDGQPNGSDHGESAFGFGSFGDPPQTLTFLASPLETSAVTTQSAADAYWQVINHVGNHWWDRDAIDSRVIGNVLDFTNPPGGLAPLSPPSAEVDYLLDAEMVIRNAGYDVDGDAMPGAWERAHGLDPEDPNDWNLDFDSDGYINLIEYINEAGEFPAPTPIVFNAEAGNRYAEIFNWRTDDGGTTSGSDWQPSRYDQAQINGGTAVVDAVGQHAGTVLVGSETGVAATLEITDGWLRVEDADLGLGTGEVVIGAGGSDMATLVLSGGELYVHELSRGEGGTFNFTGGALHAEQVNFDLDVAGGTLAPGGSIGTTTVEGNATFGEGSTLQIEFDADGADRLIVNGALDLSANETLQVVQLDGTTSGSYLIAEYTGVLSGIFDNVASGYSVNYGTVGQIFLTIGELLAGDYNDDGVVNAADYVVWRNSLASGGPLANETASLGTVDDLDYEAWRENFGAGSPPGSGAATIPEPSTAALILLALAGIAHAKARRR